MAPKKPTTTATGDASPARAPSTRITPVSFDGVPGLIIDVDGSEPRLPDGLTASEREIVALVLDGRSGQEIAALRGRSYRTIANQLATIYRKFGVNSRTELVAALSAES